MLLDGPSYFMCDKQGVVKNTILPQSNLVKKQNAVSYHAVRKAATAEILRVGTEYTETNLADILTNILG